MPTIDIGTYDGLLQAVAGWLNRADLDDQVPVFVRLAEAQLNRELRVRDMHVRSEALSALEFLALPDDFLQEYSMALKPTGGSTADLKFISKKTADTYKARGMTGPPTFYTLTDNAFELIPAPTSDLDLIMVYYARIPPLAEANQSNWLIAKSPDLYLSSSIIQAAPYLNDAARLQTWSALRDSIMSSMQLEDERAMRPQTQLVARAEPF